MIKLVTVEPICLSCSIEVGRMSGQGCRAERSRKSFQFPGYILDLRTGTYLYVAPSPLRLLSAPSFALGFVSFLDSLYMYLSCTWV